jgi:signal transduction histidine kinase
MGLLIDDMLKLSRSTRAELAVGPVDLSLLAETIVARLRQSDPARNVDVSIAPEVVALGRRRPARQRAREPAVERLEVHGQHAGRAHRVRRLK